MPPVKPFLIPNLRSLQLPCAVAVAIVSWGSAWVSIRAAIAHYSPGQLALGRYLVASLVLLPFLLRRRPRFEARDWPAIFAAGVCGFTIYNLAINAGEQTISAGAAALIGSTIPLFVALGAHFFLGQRLTPRAGAASLASFAGVVLLCLGAEGGVRLSSGALLVLLACVGATIYQLILVRLRARYNAFDLTGAFIVCGTLALVPFGSGLTNAVRSAPLSATLNVLSLGVFPGALGYVLWSWALLQGGVQRIAPNLFLIAPCAVALGWVFLGEVPSVLELLGGTLTLGGVVWCQTGTR